MGELEGDAVLAEKLFDDFVALVVAFLEDGSEAALFKLGADYGVGPV